MTDAIKAHNNNNVKWNTFHYTNPVFATTTAQRKKSVHMDTVNSLRYLWFHFLAINTGAARKQNDANGKKNQRKRSEKEMQTNAGKVRNVARTTRARSRSQSMSMSNGHFAHLLIFYGQRWLRWLMAYTHPLEHCRSIPVCCSLSRFIKSWRRAQNERGPIQKVIQSNAEISFRFANAFDGANGECGWCKSLKMTKTTIKEATAPN